MSKFFAALTKGNIIQNLIQKATDVLMESRLVKQANQTIKQLDRVFELGKDLTLESHIDELLPKIASAIRRTLGWNIVMLDRFNVYEDKFENVCYYGIKEKIFKTIRKKYPNMTRNEIAKSLGWEKKKGTFKHRYYYFIGSKKQKNIWTEALRKKYKIKEYPKGDNKNYDASFKPQTQGLLF